MNKLITILVPAYNEQDVLELFYTELCEVLDKPCIRSYKFEILFINDGSSDNTLSILKKLRLKDSRVCFVDLSRNFGKEIALSAGFDNINSNSTAIIIMDSDLQHPPELIPKLIQVWENGKDDVYGKRFDRSNEGFFKIFFAKWYYKILNAISDYEIDTDIGDFRLMDKKVVFAFNQVRESQRYNKGIFTWIGFNKGYVDYEVKDRAAGSTKWNYLALVNLAIEGITSSSIKPLRLASFSGLLVSIFAFFWLLKVLIKSFFYEEPVQGYTSMIAVILIIGGIQLLCIGVMGEYLGRVFKETKNRPLYFLNEKQVNEK
jgi:polyisoprenyl-phosphate glycosyltransferase